MTNSSILLKSEEPSCIEEKHESGVYAFKVIRLNPEVTKANFTCSLIYSMMSILCAASATGLSPLILLDPNYYNISQDHIGTLNSLILIIQSVVKIATAVPYGYFADKFGRRKVIVIGAVSFLIGAAIIPMQKTVFPGFIIATVLIANSSAAFSSVPLLADYVADESRGKASAMTGAIIFVTSMIFYVFMQLFLSVGYSLGVVLYIFTVAGFVGILLNNLGLQKGLFHLKGQQDKPKEAEAPFFERMGEAMRIFKANDWLKLSVVLQILGSSDFGIIMSFISLYVKSLFTDGTPVTDQNAIVGRLSMLSVVMMMFSNFGAGYILDKKNMIFQPSLFALLGGAVSLLLIAISTTPSALTLYLGCILFGFTVPGLFPITSLLNTRYFPVDKRGVMSGFCSIISNIAYFLIAGGGGLLYDNWERNGPFLFCAGLLVLAALMVLILYFKVKKTEETAVDKTKASQQSDSEATAGEELRTNF